ncbi:hypothetical protein ACH5RR_031060 [Cinchona calisaya]|uniref:S-adenosyl-L-methionine-dependent methyltransferase n=1 Tax=Cinchona calisaya TaxID=153742 RepID=A0ABD2YE38_9GENT
MMMILSTPTISPPSSPPLSRFTCTPQCCRPHLRRSSSSNSPFPFTGRRISRPALRRSSSNTQVIHHSTEEQPPPATILTAVRSIYNDITILETPTSRILLLDSTHSIHSIINKEEKNKWTDSYWDEFATLPAIVPDGPIAIFGLGGGTAADLMLHLWPSLYIEGWEIDEILIHKSREFLGLSELEKCGRLKVRIGDALSANASVPGGYAGIVVDLFSDGRILPELEEVETWVEMKEKLMQNGRIMVNCGGVCVEEVNKGCLDWEKNYALRAMKKAFDGEELNWKIMAENKGANFLGLTGDLPDLSTWSSALPDELSYSVHQWRRIC